MLDSQYIEVTTAADGTGSAATTRVIRGTLEAIQWVDGTFVDGVDGTFTYVCADSGVTVTWLVLTNANVDLKYYPHAIARDAAGATITYDGTNEIYEKILLNGVVTLTIAQGGATKTGGAVIFWRP